MLQHELYSLLHNTKLLDPEASTASATKSTTRYLFLFRNTRLSTLSGSRHKRCLWMSLAASACSLHHVSRSRHSHVVNSRSLATTKIIIFKICKPGDRLNCLGSDRGLGENNYVTSYTLTLTNQPIDYRCYIIVVECNLQHIHCDLLCTE